ncbi:hypothetical protein EDB89DRAFT_2009458 [Lactarius sanguifluus]|nr:hypothetical protein EDB89DRAFT_2009458 [Lactarius sanguifluus]
MLAMANISILSWVAPLSVSCEHLRQTHAGLYKSNSYSLAGMQGVDVFGLTTLVMWRQLGRWQGWCGPLWEKKRGLKKWVKRCREMEVCESTKIGMVTDER